MIAALAEAPEAIPALAALMAAERPDWYGRGGRGKALADLRDRARTEGLPLGLVAREGGAVLGGAALAATCHGAGPGEAPWIVGLLVAPEARGRGTGSARGLLRRRGWSVLRELGEGQAVLLLGL